MQVCGSFQKIALDTRLPALGQAFDGFGKYCGMREQGPSSGDAAGEILTELRMLFEKLAVADHDEALGKFPRTEAWVALAEAGGLRMDSPR